MNFKVVSYVVLVFLALISGTTSWTLLKKHSFTERECIMCRFSIGLVNYALSTQIGSEKVYRITDSFCTLAHIESPTVCSQVTKLFNKEIVKVLSHGILTANQICGLLSNNTCGHFHDPLADWEVNLNASSSLNPELLSEAQQVEELPDELRVPYKVIHISDTHVDLKYKEGSPKDCSEPLCCRSSSTPIPNRSAKAGYWGSYGSCDVPLRTFETMLRNLNRTLVNQKDIKYIIWTGDIQPHDVWDQNQKSALNTYEHVFAKIFEYLPGIRVFPTFGNHEMVPVDSFSPSNLIDIARDDSPEWLYKKVDSYWSRWLPMNTARTIVKDGFYAVTLENGLKIISLNTNFCHVNNFWLFINSVDPGNQLNWLIHELQLSELAHESVHIIGHIPPGGSDCLKVWSKNFNKIIQRFSRTISGQFYGHTHNNEFEIFYKQNNAQLKSLPKTKKQKKNYTPVGHWEPISVGYIGSSLTTFIDLNPSYSIYTMDPKQGFMPIDFETYFMNLTSANIAGPKREPKWNTFGSFTQIFSLNDTSPKSMHSLLIGIVNEILLEEQQEAQTVSQGDLLYRQIQQFNVKNSDNKPLDPDSKLYKLYRLFNAYSDRATGSTLDTITKRKQFICRFFTSQSHTSDACKKFIDNKQSLAAINSS